MGRKKIEIKRIENNKMRRVTFRKRRVGLLKKAIELSLLTGARVYLKVYHERDQSLMEYSSHAKALIDELTQENAEIVKKYTNYCNDDRHRVDQIDQRLTADFDDNMMDE